MLVTFTSLSLAAVLLMIGFVFINWVPFLKHLQLPVSIVAGLLGLLLAHISIGYFDLGPNARGVFPEKYFLQMRQVPGIFINIVFATLMLGMPKLEFGKSIRLAAPNIVMGHAFAWGQHFAGALLAIFVFSYFYENSQYMAPLIAIGPTFASLVAEAFDQIRGSAKGNVAIMLRMLGALQTIAGQTASPSRRQVLREHVQWIAELAKRTIESPRDQVRFEGSLCPGSRHI